MNETPIDTERGKRIIYVRTVLLGLRSQTAFAEWLGDVTRGAVGNWELGKPIGLDNLSAIAAKASVPFDWLAFGKGDRPTPEGLDMPIVDGKNAASVDSLIADYDAMPDPLKKLFLKRVLGLEAPEKSPSPAPAAPAKDGEERQ